MLGYRFKALLQNVEPINTFEFEEEFDRTCATRYARG